MPLVDDERRGPRPHAGDLIVQAAELLVDGAAEVESGPQILAEPGCRAPQAVRLAGRHPSVRIGLLGSPARRGDQGSAEERREESHAAFDAIVVAAGNAGTAVVDPREVGICSWVGEHLEVVAGAQGVLDGGLVFRAFDRPEVSIREYSALGRVGEGGAGIRGGDIVADHAEVRGVQAGIPWSARADSQLVAHEAGESAGIRVMRIPNARPVLPGIDGNPDIRGRRIAGVDDIEQDPFAAREFVAAVEGAVDGCLYGFHHPMHIRAGHIRRRAHMDRDRGNGDPPGRIPRDIDMPDAVRGPGPWTCRRCDRCYASLDRRELTAIFAENARGVRWILRVGSGGSRRVGAPAVADRASTVLRTGRAGRLRSVGPGR